MLSLSWQSERLCIKPCEKDSKKQKEINVEIMEFICLD